MAENYGDYNNKSEVQIPKDVPPAQPPDVQQLKGIDSTIGKLKKSISGKDFAIRHEPNLHGSLLVGDPAAAKAREVARRSIMTVVPEHAPDLRAEVVEVVKPGDVARRSIMMMIPEHTPDLEAEVVRVARPRIAKLSISGDLSAPKNVKTKVTFFQEKIQEQTEAKLRDTFYDVFPKSTPKSEGEGSASSPEKA